MPRALIPLDLIDRRFMAHARSELLRSRVLPRSRDRAIHNPDGRSSISGASPFGARVDRSPHRLARPGAFTVIVTVTAERSPLAVSLVLRWPGSAPTSHAN